jgi:hypothetical protein
LGADSTESVALHSASWDFHPIIMWKVCGRRGGLNFAKFKSHCRRSRLGMRLTHVWGHETNDLVSES